jgi:Uma2 family endonuclease
MRLSADDVFDIDVPPHLRGYELEDGRLVEVTLVTFTHGVVAAAIAFRIEKHLVEHGVRGWVSVEAGYVLRLPRDPERLRGPDISFVSEANLRAHGGAPRRGWLRLVPELVVEVDSPGREPRIERERIRNYLDVGVRLLWVVHTASRTATVYRPDAPALELRAGDTLDGGDVLPGLSVPLAELFSRIPPEAGD